MPRPPFSVPAHRIRYTGPEDLVRRDGAGRGPGARLPVATKATPCVGTWQAQHGGRIEPLFLGGSGREPTDVSSPTAGGCAVLQEVDYVAGEHGFRMGRLLQSAFMQLGDLVAQAGGICGCQQERLLAADRASELSAKAPRPFVALGLAAAEPGPGDSEEFESEWARQRKADMEILEPLERCCGCKLVEPEGPVAPKSTTRESEDAAESMSTGPPAHAAPWTDEKAWTFRTNESSPTAQLVEEQGWSFSRETTVEVPPVAREPSGAGEPLRPTRVQGEGRQGQAGESAQAAVANPAAVVAEQLSAPPASSSRECAGAQFGPKASKAAGTPPQPRPVHQPGEAASHATRTSGEGPQPDGRQAEGRQASKGSVEAPPPQVPAFSSSADPEHHPAHVPEEATRASDVLAAEGAEATVLQEAPDEHGPAQATAPMASAPEASPEPAATSAAAPQQSGAGEASEYSVVLHRTEGLSLGLDFECIDTGMLIRGLRAEGLVANWNAGRDAAGSDRIAVGDEILSVNGVRGDGLALAAEIRRGAQEMSLVIRRKPQDQADPSSEPGSPSREPLATGSFSPGRSQAPPPAESLAAKVAALEVEKKEAVAAEDFERARQLKEAIEALRSSAPQRDLDTEEGGPSAAGPPKRLALAADHWAAPPPEAALLRRAWNRAAIAARRSLRPAQSLS